MERSHSLLDPSLHPHATSSNHAHTNSNTLMNDIDIFVSLHNNHRSLHGHDQDDSMSQELPLASSSHHLDESADGGDGGGRLDHSHLGLGPSGHASGSGSHSGLGSDQLPEIEGSVLGDGAAHGKKRGRPPGTKNKPGHNAGRPKKVDTGVVVIKIKKPRGRPRKLLEDGTEAPSRRARKAIVSQQRDDEDVREGNANASGSSGVGGNEMIDSSLMDMNGSGSKFRPANLEVGSSNLDSANLNGGSSNRNANGSANSGEMGINMGMGYGYNIGMGGMSNMGHGHSGGNGMGDLEIDQLEDPHGDIPVSLSSPSKQRARPAIGPPSPSSAYNFLPSSSSAGGPGLDSLDPLAQAANEALLLESLLGRGSRDERMEHAISFLGGNGDNDGDLRL